MSESELSALEEEVMISANTYNVPRRQFREPRVHVFQSLQVCSMETAKITAVNQNIASRDGDRTMLSMGVRDDAK